MLKYIHEFDSKRITFAVVGKAGALQFWIVPRKPGDWAGPITDDYGGIEIHYAAPPAYMADKPPSQPRCHLLDGPCWHDGSSLQAEEYWIPLWRDCRENNPPDYGPIWRSLENKYRQNFSPPTTQEQ